MAMEDITPRIKFFRIAIRFLGITRLNLYEIVEMLSELGYTITTRIPPRGFKVRAGGSGPIAQKNGIIVDIDTDRLILGVSALEPEMVLKEISTLEEMFIDKFESLKEIYFYEILAEIEIETPQVDVLDFMSKTCGENTFISEISNVLDEKLCLFGYRLRSENTSPESTEWTDVEIIPNIAKPHKSLHIAIVYRTREKSRIIEKVKKIKMMPTAILKLLNNVKQEHES